MFYKIKLIFFRHILRIYTVIQWQKLFYFDGVLKFIVNFKIEMCLLFSFKLQNFIYLLL